ncbi:MAG: beta-lactamase family protein [Sphingobacteriia bacterium]|nr:beta-lactamase family protein [Sphingobacteriia bacterium]
MRNRAITIFLLALFYICSFQVYASTSIENYLKENFESGTILVIKGNKTIFNKAYGFADVNKRVLNTINTQFPIASLSKIFTSVAILKLAENNVLNINDKLDKALPTYKAKWSKDVSLHHLLTHTSGVPNYIETEEFKKLYKSPQSTQTVINIGKDLPLRFIPGSKYEYSGFGFNLLGAVIEHASNIKYEDYLANNFFIPLKMSRTFIPRNKLVSSLYTKNKILAKGYLKDKNNLIETKGLNLSLAFGEAGIISTTHDLYKWQKGLFKGKLLSENYLNLMLTNHSQNHGYGIFISTKLSNEKVYYHQGRINGFSTIMAYEPKRDIHIIILSNIMETKVYEITRKLFEMIN